MSFPNPKIQSLLTVIGLLCVAMTWAEEASAPVTLTLEKTETLALAQNPALIAASERARAADRRVLPNYLPNDPMLMVERAGQPNSPLDWGDSSLEMWMVEEQFRFPGKSLVEAGKMRAEARKARSEASDSKRDTLRQAQEAFWDFYYRTQVAALYKDTEDQWRRLTARFKERELSGQGTTVKAVRLQVDLLRGMNERLGVSKALRVSEENLAHLFNAPYGTRYVLGSIPPVTAPDSWSGTDAEAAAAHNPAVEAARAMEDAARASKHLANLEHLPDFVVRAYGERMPGTSGFNNYGMRVGVSVPLFFPFKQTQGAREAAAMEAAAKADLSDATRSAIHEIADARAEVETAWSLLKNYQDVDLPNRLRKAWEAAQVAYRNEQLAASDLIESYNMYLETLSEFYRARADYGKATARLEYALNGTAVREGSHE